MACRQFRPYACGFLVLPVHTASVQIGRPQRTAAMRLYFAKRSDSDSEAAVAKTKKKLKMFYASVQVTRIEDWCIEAETEEEARALLASGEGLRCETGDCVCLEVGNLKD
jgi:hypothetical protein